MLYLPHSALMPTSLWVCLGILACGRGPVRPAGELVSTPLGMSMRVIPAGSFTMGCTSGQSDCDDDEQPTHTVRLSHAFLLGATELTQGQWQAVMGSNPSSFRSCGTDCPVELVSWWEAAAFANAVSRKEGLETCYVISGDAAADRVTWPKGASCTGYRLPTESEWEYAARAGGDTPYAGGDDLDELAWTDSNSGGTTHRVGTRAPNAWGLSDMSGNVWEWIWDWYGDYSSGEQTDPIGASSDTHRDIRGGCWNSTAAYAHLSLRSWNAPGNHNAIVGLRLARSLP